MVELSTVGGFALAEYQRTYPQRHNASAFQPSQGIGGVGMRRRAHAYVPHGPRAVHARQKRFLAGCLDSRDFLCIAVVGLDVRVCLPAELCVGIRLQFAGRMDYFLSKVGVALVHVGVRPGVRCWRHDARGGLAAPSCGTGLLYIVRAMAPRQGTEDYAYGICSWDRTCYPFPRHHNEGGRECRCR